MESRFPGAIRPSGVHDRLARGVYHQGTRCPPLLVRPQVHRELYDLPSHQSGAARRVPGVHHFYIRIVSCYFAISIGHGALVLSGRLDDHGRLDPEKARELGDRVTWTDLVPDSLVLDLPVEISS